MTSIQLNNTYPEDERWLEAGATAFALHIAACCYTDRQDKDGLVPKSMVGRIALMVPPSEVESAVESLVESGFWSSAGRNYRINNYLEDKIGLSAEEKIGTRNKWAADKRLRRQHLNGNHTACNPKTCKYAVVSTVDSTGDSAQESTRKSKRSPGSSTLPEETIPDPTPVGGRGVGMGSAANVAASAGATASTGAAGLDGLAPSRPTYAHPMSKAPAPVVIDGVRHRPRLHPDGSWISADWLGFGPWDVSEEVFIQAVQLRREDDADRADTLDGLIPGGSLAPAGGAGTR